jgi:hypothetical protein
VCRLSSSQLGVTWQDTVSKAHDLTGYESRTRFVSSSLLNIQKRRGDSVFNTITSATTQKIRLKNCTHEQLFKALAQEEAKLATTTIKDKNRATHAVKSISDMSEHHVGMMWPQILMTSP